MVTVAGRGLLGGLPGTCDGYPGRAAPSAVSAVAAAASLLPSCRRVVLSHPLRPRRRVLLVSERRDPRGNEGFPLAFLLTRPKGEQTLPSDGCLGTSTQDWSHADGLPGTACPRVASPCAARALAGRFVRPSQVANRPAMKPRGRTELWIMSPWSGWDRTRRALAPTTVKVSTAGDSEHIHTRA